MSEEIKELDMDKYLVIKTEDLEKYFSQFTKGIFSTPKEIKYINKIPFTLVLEEIQKQRESEGKTENKYLVLNLEDEIDTWELLSAIEAIAPLTKNKNYGVKVKDIAVTLVNAILKAKGD